MIIRPDRSPQSRVRNQTYSRINTSQQHRLCHYRITHKSTISFLYSLRRGLSSSPIISPFHLNRIAFPSALRGVLFREMSSVRIVEVSPRDGLQNEKFLVPTNIKTELIDRLSRTG